jgi:formiminotetrahydrofolate cyclodeaminase
MEFANNIRSDIGIPAAGGGGAAAFASSTAFAS